MGLVAPEVHTGEYYASGSFNRYINPPAIHLVLPEEEFKGRFSLYQGSGGTVASLLSTTQSGANTKILAEAQSKLSNIVDEICVVFGLTKEELAQICKVQSRKTLYNWINGETRPRKAAMSRLYSLLLTARAWTNAGLSSDSEKLHEAILGKQSLFDLLSQTEIDNERILFAGTRLNFESLASTKYSDPFA